MSHILGIKFRDHGQVYYFESGPFVVAMGDDVLVQTEQGLGMGRVVVVRDDPPEAALEQELKPIFRLPTQEDVDTRRENDQLAREAHTWCRRCIETRNLEMKLVDVEVLHDRTKIVFYFTAPGRVDFRELVKDLVKAYHTRIELRQIGVRHETQMLGAIGNCGQICCCRRFMRKFAPVTIKMAKEQNLFLNPTKISGICGRLLCCLSFEQENYEQFQKKCPRVGKKFATAFGMAKVLRTNLFRETVTVLDEAGDEREMTVEEWTQAVENRPVAPEGVIEAADGSRPDIPRFEPPRPDAPRAPSPRPESGRSAPRGESRRSEGPAGERRGAGRDQQSRDQGRDQQGRGDQGRDQERRRGREAGAPAAPRAAAAPGAPEGTGPDAAAAAKDAVPAGANPPQGEGRVGAGRSSRRGRRPGRRPPLPGGEAAPEQQPQPRSRPKRPDARQGGKPSREPESGS
ncbi:PSP1 domain-containing protein [Desulfovibrio sp. TomC]|uniref:PSP1 domain-containing protein n=1 Tax=Desulfovibrio sp. TomC TaxID=1562888 RepID=UPI0005750401|nr:stage 0 sporulation family protein [Desulfovibrio sp. TomC]KHK01269.1 Signal peptidase-like protein [Desulfovibrio sp. TomC]